MSKRAVINAARQVYRKPENVTFIPTTQSRAAKWMQKATKRMERKGTEGEFSEKAKRAGMSTLEYANKVLSNPNAPADLKKQANFARNAIRVSRKRKGR